MARTKRKNPELAVEIGRVIRKQRKAAGMTQAVFAEAIGLESETVSRMENGIRLPTIEKLVEMADLFRLPVGVFFENVGPLKKQQDTQLLVEKISVALDKLPDTGRNFVLEVAQNYARYHLTKPKAARKKD
jgi:transcriptional regulator with XRE-family HTH domain